jgi:uncharacterized protein involved in tolerance to divalent cations
LQKTTCCQKTLEEHGLDADKLSIEDEALKIANALVEDHLAACVNLVSPIRSIYRWEGKIWDEREWLLIIKPTNLTPN